MPIMQSAPGAETILDGRRYLYFAGTGYLGLQGHPDVLKAAADAVYQYGVSSATSRAGFGDNPPTLEVEQRAATYFGAEAAFYYISGYVGNSILALWLRDQFDVAFLDELAHYSVVEGVAQAQRPVVRFRHCDAEDLVEKLVEHLKPGQRPLLMSDGVFPSLGHIAPVPAYLEALAHYPGALICLDDAHAGGAIGAMGRGTYDYFGLDAAPGGAPGGLRNSKSIGLYYSGTLSKALGGQGGLISGSREWIDKLKASSHFFNGASQPAVPVAAASAKALEIVTAHPQLRQQLAANARRAKAGLRRMGLKVDDTPVPIIPLVIGSGPNMDRIQQCLMAQGIAIAYAKAYAGTGPEGLLRIAIFATHTPEMIDRLLDELGRCL
jgi:7-keto-8-aminopelargonate synthetase-like enzyme